MVEYFLKETEYDSGMAYFVISSNLIQFPLLLLPPSSFLTFDVLLRVFSDTPALEGSCDEGLVTQELL